jgi:predicted metal-dependent hydrolase
MLKRLFTAIRSAAPPKPDERAEMEIGGTRRVIIFRRSARAKRYTLRLKPGSTDFVVTMPMRGTLTFAKDFVERHRGWMEKRLSRSADHTPFEPGAVIPFCGVPHVIEHRPAMRGATRIGVTAAGSPCIAVSGTLPHVPRRVADFLKKEAQRQLTQAVEKHARALDVAVLRVTIRDTVSRWGSCSSKGALSFSWRIVMAPPFVLDYLAAHEVAHRREMNHSARYWKVVAGLDPAYEKAEAWLKRHASSLHQYGPTRA